jgi:hypothetical protein
VYPKDTVVNSPRATFRAPWSPLGKPWGLSPMTRRTSHCSAATRDFPCGGPSPYCHQSVGWHLELRCCLLHRSGFVRRLDFAQPDGFAGDLVDIPAGRLRRFRSVLRHRQVSTAVVASNHGLSYLIESARGISTLPGFSLESWCCRSSPGLELANAQDRSAHSSLETFRREC